jgi:RNA polymerase sigma-70 factor (ECF subfamily)
MDSSEPASATNPGTTPPDPPRTPADNPAALAMLQTGDRAAFQTALRPLLPSLLTLARRLTGDPHWAEDLVQETLVRACRGIRGFRGECSLRTWLFQIQVRLAGQPSRWKGRQPDSGRGDLIVPDNLATQPGLESEERELAERLDEAMERLTTRQRTALHLRAVEGLDYRAISQVLGGSHAASRMLVLAARRQILRRMGRHLLP